MSHSSESHGTHDLNAPMSDPSMTVGLVERLREIYHSSDHERGCQGREYSCTCGYDDRNNETAWLADNRILDLADRIAVLEAALTRSRIALDDWLNTYAADHCNPDRVKEAWERIGLEGGTLAYIASVQEQNCNALEPKPAGRQALSEHPQ